MQRYNPMTKCLETVKITDSKKRRTADKGIFVKKVHKSVKSALGNTYYIVEDDRGHLWVTTDKTGNGGGTMEFSMANAVKTLKDYLKMDELEKKYGKEEGYKKWMRGEDRKTIDAGYDSPSQMESKLKNFVNKAKTANSKQELEKINNDLFFYVAKLKSNVLKKYGTTNNKFNSTEEWDKNYSKIASKYMSELQRLVDNFKMKDHKTVDANNADLLLKRLDKDAKKIQGIVSEIIRRKEWGNIDERGIKNLNKMIVMAESTIDELANISYRALSLPK